MFVEAESPRPWLLLLLALFAVMIGLSGWLPELGEWEARYMLAAQAWVWGDGITVSQHAPGVTSMLPPLPVWCLAPLAWLRAWPGLELVRVAAALPAVGLAAGCAWVSYRVAGRTGAAVTAAMVLGILAVQKSEHVNIGALLVAALLNAAWLVWFFFCRERKHWLYAWTVALLLVWLAALAGGSKAFLLFYLPLAILRRPLSPWKRLSRMDHWLSLALVGGLVAYTVALVPGTLQAMGVYLGQLEPPELDTGYLARFFLFPVLTAGACLPWVAFAWPAFCAGFIPLEKHPVLGQLLRTIVVVVFCLYWADPDGRPKDLLPLLGPLAVLTGMHYDLLVRRHGRMLRLVPRTLAVLALALAAVGALAWTLAAVGALNPLLKILRLGDGWVPSWVMVLALGSLGLAVVMGVMVLRARPASPLWLLTMLAVVAVQGAWVGTVQVYHYARRGDLRQHFAYLTENLPPNARLLAVSSDLKLHASDYYALGRPVHNLERSADAPAKPGLSLLNLSADAEVYVLKSNLLPSNQWRDWTPMCLPVSIGEDRVRVYRGTRRGVVSAPVPVSPNPAPVAPPAPGPAIVPIPAVVPSTTVAPSSVLPVKVATPG